MDDFREREPGWPPPGDPATESPADLYVHQPAAERVLRPLEGAAWRPNAAQIGVAGGVVGLTAALVAALAPAHSVDWLLAAWLLFAFAVASRVRRSLGPGGRPSGPEVALREGMVDLVVAAAFWAVLAVRTTPSGAGALGGLFAVGGVLSTLVHAGLYEHIRLRFRTVAEPPPAREDEPLSSTPGAQPYPWRSGGLSALTVPLFSFAEGFCDALYNEVPRLSLGVEPGAPAPAVDRAEGRRLLAAPMQMATYLSLSTHLFILYVSAALATLHSSLPFWTASLAVVVGLNAWALCVVIAWRRAEALLARLATSPRA